MSSMRNAVQRRNHKERAQPLERKKWGLLEKHKDYSLRAADHNAKKRKIKQLTSKARERNEDEFYFAMVNASTDGGRRKSKRGEENGGGKSLDEDVVRLMKTQDAGYLQTMLQHARREREACDEEIVLGRILGKRGCAVGGGKSVIFEENGEQVGVGALPEVAKADIDAMEEDDGFEDFDDDVDGKVEEDSEEEGLTHDEKKKRHKLDVGRRKLDALKDREAQLSTALRELEDQRARMNGTVGGVNKSGVKFKIRQRKR